MTGTIHLSAPDIGPLEESYLIAALRSGWVAPVGPDLDAFEREVAARVGTRGAVAVSSGTAALHLALLGLGVGPGDVVLVPTLTFVATANAVRYTGARPVFVDCDPRTGNLDVALVAELLRDLRSRGERIGAVIPVDMFGSCADYAALLPICAAADVAVVEDAAEALGATHLGRPAGSFGRVGALSFNGNKIMTTSGGGMLVGDDVALLDRARHLSTQAREPVAHYEHRETGYNYRLSNLLAALGRAQLIRLDGMIDRRGGCATGTPNSSPRCPGPRWSAPRTPVPTAGSPASGSTRAVPAGPRRTWPPTCPPGTSRPVRCGSRCTCNRRTPTRRVGSPEPPNGSTPKG